MSISIHTQKRVAVGIGLFGAALMLYMILVEDEPGALPLGLILVSIVWLFGIKVRTRNERV